jgi:hypothetical protein
MASRTRDLAGVSEVEDINTIIYSINNPTPLGLKIMTAFRERHGKEITSARARPGTNRGTHYDFEILVGGRWMKVEHKGSIINTPIPETNTVCKSGVQFHNGGCNLYTLPEKYAKIWYDMYISSGTLKQEFTLAAALPSFTDWYEKDCKTQGNPKTPFGIELKKKVRELGGPRTSLLEKRRAVNTAFEMTHEDQHLLKEQVLARANSVLAEKDYWLEIRGLLSSDCHIRWWPKYTITNIHEVIVKKHNDIKIEFHCEDNFIFHAYLRWGKGAGFSNLRFDLRHGPASGSHADE